MLGRPRGRGLGYEEVDPFNDEIHAHHWIAKPRPELVLVAVVRGIARTTASRTGGG